MNLTASLLRAAYSKGIFPMAASRDDPTLHWIDPEMRGQIPLERFHLPRRLRRTVRQGRFTVTIDRDFRRVMEGCAASAPGRETTWINDTILAGYEALFASGAAHSVECREGRRLVGGLYGVSLGGAFFGESMFSLATDASKVALVHLVARLKLGGFRLLDTQFLTAHLARFGAIEIPRAAYLVQLAAAIAEPADFYRAAPDWPPAAVLAALAPSPEGAGGGAEAAAAGSPKQSTTQTS